MANYLNDLRVFSAERFRDSVAGANSAANLYMTFGKSNAWANDSAPPTVIANNVTNIDLWFNMIGAKKITSNDVRHVVKRFIWSANTVYSQYDDQNTTLFDGNTQFYVVTSNHRVYKCLDNRNGRLSTIEPSSVNTSSAVTLSDGYTWKYMYTLTDEERFRFVLPDYMPVKTLRLDDGSLQWDVQQAAVQGAIHSIKVTNTGSGYTNASNIIVSISGDGTGATATATLNTVSNTVNAIVMTTFGSGYRTANVRITGGGGSNASGRVVLAPLGGHGSNPVYELGGSNILIDTRLVGTQGDKYPKETQFRQIAIIKDPLKYNTSTIMSNSVISQFTTLSLYNYAVGVGVPTEYEIGEEVYQGTSLTDYTFKGRVVEWDAANSIVKVSQTRGAPVLIGTLYGANTSTTKVVNSVVYPDLKPYTGQVLYVDNITPITKDADQTEDLKVLIKF